ncbi:hypothetical protein KKHLCK_04415 [Candidatus Electrothrix laxa]
MRLKAFFKGALFGAMLVGMFASVATAGFTSCSSGVVTKAVNSYDETNPYYVTIDCDDDTKWSGELIFMVGTVQSDPMYATALSALASGQKVTAGVANNTDYSRIFTLGLTNVAN